MLVDPYIIVVEIMAILAAIGVMFAKDNLYAALYLALASGLSATALLVVNGVLPFVMVVMIYIGATITITIVLAATYRRPVPHSGVNVKWLALAVVVAVLAIAAMRPTYTASVEASQVPSTNISQGILSSTIALAALAMLVIFLSVVMVMTIRYLRVMQS